MTDYAGTWKKAKSTFEDETGGKKPSEKVKALRLSFRKKSGVAAKLKEVDKLIPDNLLEPIDDKTMKKATKAVDEAKSAGAAYMAMVQKAIDAEKTGLGKDASPIYRDLKILRSTLDQIVDSIKADLAKMFAARAADAKGVAKTVKVSYITIRTLGEGIDKNAKQALAMAQGMLKDGTPEAYNRGIQKAARDLTQQFANIRKWTMPDELNPTHKANRDKVMADPKIAALVADLDKKVSHFKKETLPLLKLEGTTPTDATLGQLATDKIKLSDDASPAEVKAAVKHLVGLVKDALVLGRKLPR